MARQAGRSLSDGVLSSEQPPSLEPGDRLTRAEFERRYEAMPQQLAKPNVSRASFTCYLLCASVVMVRLIFLKGY